MLTEIHKITFNLTWNMRITMKSLLEENNERISTTVLVRALHRDRINRIYTLRERENFEISHNSGGLAPNLQGSLAGWRPREEL